MNSNNFFVMESDEDDQESVNFRSALWTPELPDIYHHTNIINTEDFVESYFVNIKAKKFNSDYYINDYMCSDSFIDLCHKFNVEYISRPILINLHKTRIPAKHYNLFLITKKLNILNLEESVYTIDKDKYTGSDIVIYHPDLKFTFYEKIEKFIINNNVNQHLFFCGEILSYVCSEEFMNEYKKRKLSGIRFVSLDKTFQYDPWKDFCN